MIRKFNQFINEEAAPRIPNKPEYWINKLKKRGKDVMIYTHDDLDGIFSAIAIKKYFKDHGFNIIGYGLVSYQDGWSIIKIDPKVINVAVDFAEFHPDIDVYIDHHGEFVDGDEISELAKKRGAMKTKTGSAYEGIMDQLGLPVDSLVLSVIDMVDSAKYDDYGVKWTDLLDFNPKEIIKKPNAKLLFAGAFNQLLKRSETATIIETIHNVDEPSIYKIFDYMRKLYPGNNPMIPRGYKEEDFTPEEIDTLLGRKEFVEDAKSRIEQMKVKTRGAAEFKGIIKSQQEFVSTFSELVEYPTTSRSKFAGQSAHVIKMDGYCIIGELAFVGSGTWANAIRARSIIQQDIESGRLPEEAKNTKWVLLQYGDTLQVCSYGKIENYPPDDLPKTKNGQPIDDLKKYCVDLLNNFKTILGFKNPDTVAGGHKSIGSISNIGIGRLGITEDDKEYYFSGLRYLDIFKNYMICNLSKIPWRLNLSWENPFSADRPTEPTPVGAHVLMINQIRKINKQTGQIEYPENYQKRLSMKQMKENEAKLKKLERDLADQQQKDRMAKYDAKHEYYRTHKADDISYEEWSELQKNKEKNISESLVSDFKKFLNNNE